MASAINDWELIGSRTYSWKGNEVLRCKHWDKVAIRWHLSTCDEAGKCEGGTNVDYATKAQNWTEMPVWRNAFTFVQVPGQPNVSIMGQERFMYRHNRSIALQLGKALWSYCDSQVGDGVHPNNYVFIYLFILLRL
uniref:Uncharacterized protein n=1 Tax=Caenorhabditis japonica TaxID=281687 RepID=A0A8R1E2F5_CAEJA